jgi:DNA modification methylase
MPIIDRVNIMLRIRLSINSRAAIQCLIWEVKTPSARKVDYKRLLVGVVSKRIAIGLQFSSGTALRENAESLSQQTLTTSAIGSRASRYEERLERGGAIRFSSRAGENVLDLFGGSGSTLIGCEQTNRKAYLMVVVPPRCDVSVERWENFTGRKAIRVSSRQEVQV